jgi:hypothetical protein
MPRRSWLRPDVAARQIEEVRTEARAGTGGTGGGTGTVTTTSPAAKGRAEGAAAADLLRRFYGRISVEPVRMLRDMSDIADAIVAQLGRADAAVTISVEITATTDKGFPTTCGGPSPRTPAHSSSRRTSSRSEVRASMTAHAQRRASRRFGEVRPAASRNASARLVGVEHGQLNPIGVPRRRFGNGWKLVGREQVFQFPVDHLAPL